MTFKLLSLTAVIATTLGQSTDTTSLDGLTSTLVNSTESELLYNGTVFSNSTVVPTSENVFTEDIGNETDSTPFGTTPGTETILTTTTAASSPAFNESLYPVKLRLYPKCDQKQLVEGL